MCQAQNDCQGTHEGPENGSSTVSPRRVPTSEQQPGYPLAGTLAPQNTTRYPSLTKHYGVPWPICDILTVFFQSLHIAVQKGTY